MTIKEALQAANDVTTAKVFAFADIREFNSFQNSFEDLEYPINVVIPVQVSGNVVGNRYKETALIQGWFLTRIHDHTNDYRSAEIEDVYINPMRENARKFLQELRRQDIYDSEVEEVSHTIIPEYMFLANHLFGVSYTINLPITGKVC